MKIDPGDRDLYRSGIAANDLVRSRVVVKETDLLVLAERDISDLVRDIVLTQRDRLERYIAGNPSFRDSLLPMSVSDTAPGIVKSMALAGQAAGVGPMAAVAGAVCEAVAGGVGDGVRELILENGGDLYVASARERIIGIFAGAGSTRWHHRPAAGARTDPDRDLHLLRENRPLPEFRRFGGGNRARSLLRACGRRSDGSRKPGARQTRRP